VRELEDWDARFDVLEGFLLARLAAGPEPDPAVAWAWERLRERRIERAPPHWARIASEAGYADQPHLNREFQQFAGTTPTDFVARMIPGGGVVGDGCASAA
jgi:AraC-like DNA-binding protein